MSFDIELILQAISQRFDAFEAKWETRFPSGGAAHHLQEATSELASPSQAPPTPAAAAEAAVSHAAPLDRADAGPEVTLVAHVPSTVTGEAENVEPLSASWPQPGAAVENAVSVSLCATKCSAAAAVTFCDAIFVSSGSEETAARHVVVEDDTTSAMPTRCSTHVPTPTHVPINNTAATSASSAPTQAVGGPAGASSIGLQAWLVPTCPPTLAVLGAGKEVPNVSAIKCSTVCLSQPRYITSMIPSLLNGTALLCVGIDGHDHEKVLESMTSHSTMVFGPLFAYIFDKEKWPPPIYFVSQKSNVQLRPIPWPSFDSWNVNCANCQHSKRDQDFVLWIPGKIAWLFAELVCWSSNVGAAMTVITGAHVLSFWSSSTEITIPLTFIVGDTVKRHILQVAVHGKSVWEFLNRWQSKQCLVALSYSVNYCWVQWEIPWLFSVVVIQLTALRHADFGKLLMDMAVLKWLIDQSAGCCCFCLLLLPSTLPSAWWQLRYPSVVPVRINPNCFWRQFYLDSSTQKKQCCICPGTILLPFSLIQFYDIQFYDWAMKLHRHCKYFGLTECCVYESGGLLFINTWSIQKLLHTSTAYKMFTANLSSFNGTVQSQMRILCDILQPINGIPRIYVLFYLCKPEPDATAVQVYIPLLSLIVGLVTGHLKIGKLISSLRVQRCTRGSVMGHLLQKLLNLKYQSFAVCHFQQYASEIPRMFGSVGKPLFILHFYTMVIKDP
ncbi:unnamed protein product [Urochloa humidicola]